MSQIRSRSYTTKRPLSSLAACELWLLSIAIWSSVRTQLLPFWGTFSLPNCTLLVPFLLANMDYVCTIHCSEIHLNYSDSRFGAILNHMVDRIAFIGLLMHLCERYHGYWAVFLPLVALMYVIQIKPLKYHIPVISPHLC